MSSTIFRIAQVCYAARRRVIGTWLVVTAAVVALTVVGGGAFDDEFHLPGSSSQEALDQLKMTFPEAADTTASMLVVAPAGEVVDDPDTRAKVETALSGFATLPWVNGTLSPYSTDIEGLVSADRSAAYAMIRLRSGADVTLEAQRTALDDRAREAARIVAPAQVYMGGSLYAASMPTVSWVEGLGVLVALLVLILTLGSVRAAVIPLLAALLGALLSVLGILIAAGLVQINSTTLMLALMLAIAVGIDYSLFVVSRHRDQLAGGMDEAQSAALATATAGSAVVFAGVTVIIALLGLGIVGIPFLTTMGVFAAVAVAVEVLLALTLLPAMLGFLGPRLRPKARHDKAADASHSGRWSRLVTAKPLLTILLVVVGLGALAVPAKDLWLALPNSGRSAPGEADRVAFDLLSEKFGAGVNGQLVVTAQIVESADPLGVVEGLKADILAMPGVLDVPLATPNPNADTALVQIVPATGPDDPATADLVHRLRDRSTEWQDRYGVDTAVTGFTAVAIDVTERLTGSLVPFAVVVVGLSLLLLTVVFRSLLVPVKAALGYLLSVGGALGAVTLVFNEGVLKSWVNLPEAVPVITFLPVVLMGILFGLAMDYEVFLTSRMREEFVRGSQSWVHEGFAHSGKVVIAAACIMVVVFASFVPHGNGIVKPIAFGLAIGVFIDAFLVRMTLGPAVMALIGSRAWWLPSWLERRLPTVDIEGDSVAHRLEVAAWPSPDAPGAAYIEGLAATYEGQVVFTGLDVTLAHGDVLVVTGGAPSSRTAVGLAMTGRLYPTAGKARVLGCALPEDAAILRPRTRVIDGRVPGVLNDRIESATELLFVDRVEALDGPARACLVDVLSDPTNLTVVVTAREPWLVADLVSEVARPRIHHLALGLQSVDDLGLARETENVHAGSHLDRLEATSVGRSMS